jgi:phosphatidylglycerophosphatase A
MTRLAVFISTVAYTGYFPFAPGTIGSLAGLLVYAGVRLSGSAAVEALVIVAVFAAGVWSGSVAERYFGGIDPGPVVIDEVVGMLVTLAFIPVGWSGALAGFVIFRILDIVKPYPSRRLENLHGGWGVVLDDAMAAVYGNLVLRGLMAVAPGWIA